MRVGAMRPDFSVVVPTLGRARHLEECLAAMAGLEYPPERFEVVVVNDGGGREVDQVTSGREGELSLTVVSTAAVGAAGARNAGSRAARGRFLAFTDDDCKPESGWLRALQACLEAHPGCAVGGTVVNGVPGRGAAANQAVMDATHAHFNRNPAAPRFFASCNVAFPADQLRAAGGFDERFRYAEDRELCERWLRSGRRFARAPEAVVRHMRELTLSQLGGQHFRYGLGAWTLYRVRAERGWGGLRIQPRFYLELARRARNRREGVERTSVTALAITQAAYAAGFARQGLRRREHQGFRPRPRIARL